jgi:hypothetical protein
LLCCHESIEFAKRSQEVGEGLALGDRISVCNACTAPSQAIIYAVEEQLRIILRLGLAKPDPVRGALQQIMEDRVRAMLADAALPLRQWGEAVRTAAYVRNRSPAAGKVGTPLEIFTGRKPDVSHLRVFSCKAFASCPGHMVPASSPAAGSSPPSGARWLQGTSVIPCCWVLTTKRGEVVARCSWWLAKGLLASGIGGH